MKTITVDEAQRKLVRIMDNFIELCSMFPDKPIKLYSTVEDVGFLDLIFLYYRLKSKDKRLFMPEELDSDCMTLIYRPAPGCTILFETDRCSRVMPHIQQANGHPFGEPFIVTDFKKWKNPICVN